VGGKTPRPRPIWTIFLAETGHVLPGVRRMPKGNPTSQYRGGPPGFLKVIDEADCPGSPTFGRATGNTSHSVICLKNPEWPFIFLMDYANGQRVENCGARQRVIENDPDLLRTASRPRLCGVRVERAILFSIEAWDINCSQTYSSTIFRRRQIAPIVEKTSGAGARTRGRVWRRRARAPVNEVTTEKTQPGLRPKPNRIHCASFRALSRRSGRNLTGGRPPRRAGRF